MRLAEIGQIGLVTIADIEQVSQSFDGIALLAFAQQCGDRHAEKVPQEIEQRRLKCRHRVNGGAQIEGLGAAATDIAIRETFPYLVQNIVVHPDRATNDQRPRILQRLTDARATGNFAHARVAGIVLEDDDVASEKRSVRTAQVQEHAVMTSHRYDRHLSHDRRFPRDALRHETLPANSARRKIGRPMVGTFPVCCARAVSGHPAAVPSSVMNWRRFTARCLPVLPTERIAHLGTVDCCIHPRGRNEMIAITPPKIFSKEWSAPLGVDRYEAVQSAICRAYSSSKLTGLLYPSAEW